MRKLIALCAILGFTTQASAQVEMSHTGGLRLSYKMMDNAGFSDKGATTHDWMHRFRLNSVIKAGENINVHSQIASAATWGNNADQYPGDGSNASIEQDDVLLVNELYANWMISDELMARLGRGSFTLADGTVVAANEWEQVQKAYEGGLLSYDHEMARISGFMVRGANSSTGAGNYGNFFGVSVDVKALPEFLKMVNLHYVVVKRDMGAYDINGTSVNYDKEDASRYGVTLGGDVAGVDYRATYAMYQGETTTFNTTTKVDVDASMLDAEVGYSLPDLMNLRISALYHTDSGNESGTSDNEAYNGFHYDVHNNAGLMDIVGWGNLTYTKIGLSADVMEDISAGLAYYMFTATEKADTTNGTSSGLVSGSTALSADTTKDDIGNEIDLSVTKRYSSNFSITGWYAMFQAGDRIGTNAEDRTQVYLSGNYTF